MLCGRWSVGGEDCSQAGRWAEWFSGSLPILPGCSLHCPCAEHWVEGLVDLGTE